MDFGIPELLIILLIVLLLFGSTRLPKLSHSVGEAMRELRDGLSGSAATPKNKEAKSKDNTAEAKRDVPETKTPESKDNIAETNTPTPETKANVAETTDPVIEVKENTTEA